MAHEKWPECELSGPAPGRVREPAKQLACAAPRGVGSHPRRSQHLLATPAAQCADRQKQIRAKAATGRREF